MALLLEYRSNHGPDRGLHCVRASVRDRAPGFDPGPSLGRDHVRGPGLVCGPNGDHVQLARGLLPNNPERIALDRSVAVPSMLLRTEPESSSPRAICNACLLDTSTLPPR